MKIYMVPAGDDGVNVRLDRGDGKIYSFKGSIIDSELKREFDDYDDFGPFGSARIRAPRTTYTLEIDVRDLTLVDTSAAEQMAELFSSFPQRYVMAMPQDSEDEIGPFIETVAPEATVTPSDVPADWIDLNGA